MSEAEFKEAVEDRLRQLFAEKMQQAPTKEAVELLKITSDLIQRGGKRIRPRLMFTTFFAYRKPEAMDMSVLIDIGAALELFHQYLLIHDDIIDNDIVRYDGLNVTGHYRKTHANQPQDIGMAMGLIAGDVVFSFAIDLVLSQPSLTSKQKCAILKLVNDVNIQVQYGQQLDALNIEVSDDSSFEKLLLTYELKTASYTTVLPLSCAAILAKLHLGEQRKLQKFAELFGVMFQFMDDYSDYFVNISAFNNHPKYRDYQQGKVTQPLALALKYANPKDRAFLLHSLGKKQLSLSILEQVSAILEKTGAKTESGQLINTYFGDTSKALDTLAISLDSRAHFRSILDTLKI